MTRATYEDHRLPHPEGGHITISTNRWEGWPERLVLAAHGFGSRRWGRKTRALARACASRGWGFATVDCRGHGHSSGLLHEMCGSSLQADLDLVTGWLRERGMEQVCLAGSSMGGWASAWFAVRRPELVRACVLMAPALDFIAQRWDPLTPEERANWQRTGRHRLHNAYIDVDLGYGLIEERDQFPLSRLEAELRTPTRLIHGIRDTTVSWRGSLAFVERASLDRLELVLLKNGDHRLSGQEVAVAELACEFFAHS